MGLEDFARTPYVSGGGVYPCHSPQFERFVVNTGVIPVEIGLYMSPAEASYRYILAGQGKIVASRARKQRLCTLRNVNNSRERVSIHHHKLPS